MKLVFLVEEPSMAEVLHGILPRVLPHTVTYQCVPHEGKQDLEKSIPRKLRSWKEPGVRFVVLRDQDASDCYVVKERLIELCRQNRRGDTLVRIVCRELESWFLGDMGAVAKGLKKPELAGLQRKARYRQPDTIRTPSKELSRLAPSYQKISGARAISPHLDLEKNTSRSFQNFLHGVRRLIEESYAQ